jgi:hypothetical protein
VNTYLVRLNGCPWFTMTLAAHRDARPAAYAVARGEAPEGVTVTWLGGAR